MSKRFERILDSATEQTLVEPNWEGILECVDMIRGLEVPVKDAVSLIQRRYHSINPHVAHHALLVLEACVKNCGKRFHIEIATKEFLDDLQGILMSTTPEKVKSKILELIQCWASAFRNNPEYKIVIDIHNFLKLNGFTFPVFKEADAMFMADSAPDWAEGDNCYRCRSEFGVFTRKHHCRACGQIFCDKCSNKQMLLPQFGIEKKVRVCESCYEKPQKSFTTNKNNITGASQLNNEAAERKRQQELADKEAEELQLVLAISQSEADAKKQQENRQHYNSVSSSDIYKGSATSVVEDKLTDESFIDPILAKYLDRDYWEQKKNQADNTTLFKATAPPPSDNSSSINNGNHNGYASSQRCGTPSTIATVTNDLKSVYLEKQQNSVNARNDEKEVDDTFQFCNALQEMVETMKNRMKSNSARGRSIINDSAIHSLFIQLTNYHANVLSRMAKLDADQVYYEKLQDHLADIQDSREAMNALSEDFKQKEEERLREEQAIRRNQVIEKLELMRQKKHSMLFYQRNMALQRFQQQEHHIQQVRNMQTQQSLQSQQIVQQNQQFVQQQIGGQVQQFAEHLQFGQNKHVVQLPQQFVPNQKIVQQPQQFVSHQVGQPAQQFVQNQHVIQQIGQHQQFLNQGPIDGFHSSNSTDNQQYWPHAQNNYSNIAPSSSQNNKQLKSNAEEELLISFD